MTAGGIASGEIVGGKYRIVRVLGEGGMAIVYEAEHVRLRQRVAVKVLRDELASIPMVVERFEREGRALSALRSRNFVRVHDVDVTPTGAPYLVMELLEGGDLDTEIRQRGALPIGEGVGYIEQACAAMREAHAHGIVHRDLKPTNIFLAREGANRVVKVLDFGIATDGPPASDAKARLTRTDSVMGTPLYMSPEQFRSTRDVDARADIWALGATLYELLTGQPPFTGSATTIGVSIVTEDPTPIEELRPDVPFLLREIVSRSLAKDREERFQTMQDLAEALAPFSEATELGPRASAHSFAQIAEAAAASTLPLATSSPSSAGPVSAISVRSGSATDGMVDPRAATELPPPMTSSPDSEMANQVRSSFASDHAAERKAKSPRAIVVAAAAASALGIGAAGFYASQGTGTAPPQTITDEAPRVAPGSASSLAVRPPAESIDAGREGVDLAATVAAFALGADAGAPSPGAPAMASAASPHPSANKPGSHPKPATTVPGTAAGTVAKAQPAGNDPPIFFPDNH